MKEIELVPGIRSSVLGFGCAPIGGSVSPEVGAAAILRALEHGVTHFDVAPSYGYGEAEKTLGRSIGYSRSKVIIATKFGIETHPLAPLFGPLKDAVRAIRQLRSRPNRVETPQAGSGKAVSNALHRKVPITAQGLTASVEQSLRQLKTDYLDYLVLHEPTCPIDDIDGVMSAVDSLKTQGKLRGFGMSFYAAARASVSPYESIVDFLQFDTPIDRGLGAASFDDRTALPNVLFSPIRAMKASARTDAKDFLTTLSADFPQSVILCTMMSEKHLQENLKWARKPES